MLGEIPFPLSLAPANRQLWANYNAAQNPYALFALTNASWALSEFIIDLDDWLLANNPILGDEAPTKLRFGLFGGIGGASKSGFDLKSLNTIGRLASQPGAFHFHLLLGNNFGESGVNSPKSDLFTEYFDSVFNNVDCFAVLGQDDHFSNWNHSSMYRAMCQVQRSYLGREINGRKNHWNMPYRYYALVSKATNAVFICIDSSMLLFDPVQQIWLYSIYEKLKKDARYRDATFILVSHHPVQMPYTKDPAIANKEWKNYIPTGLASSESFATPRHIETPNPASPDIRANFIAAPSISRSIDELLTKLNLKFNIILSGHEQLLSYENMGTHQCQLISGAAGNKPVILSEKDNFYQMRAATVEEPLTAPPARSVYTATPGYAMATLEKDKFKFGFFSHTGAAIRIHQIALQAWAGA